MFKLELKDTPVGDVAKILDAKLKEDLGDDAEDQSAAEDALNAVKYVAVDFAQALRSAGQGSNWQDRIAKSVVIEASAVEGDPTISTTVVLTPMPTPEEVRDAVDQMETPPAESTAG